MHILLQTSYLHARDFLGFYFRLLTFIKIKFLQKKSPGIIIRLSNSLDPDQDRRSGFKLFAKGYWQTTKFSAGMQRVITVVFTILSNILDIHVMYTINIRTL